MRLLFVFAVTAVVALLSSILFTAQPAFAAPADPTWSGQSISYDGKTFTGPIESTGTDSHNIPTGSKYYSYTDPVPAGGAAAQRKAYFIYFTPGTDPSAATAGTYVTYDYTPPDVYSNPSPSTTVNMTPSTAGASTAGTTSCDVGDGIGWLICPITNQLAKGMDWLFGILSDFLKVRPVQTNQQTALYRAWSVMQSFANVAFVIAFLIIIYSQLAGGMMTNYGIKKLLPRLIAAAILVNISYWICSVAVDVSNILGYSVQDIFINIRNSLVGQGGNGWNVTSWQSIVTVVLSGATVIGAGIIAGHGALAATGGGFSAAIYLLLPVLAGVVLAVVVAVLILAARQAIITILIILSPLAFVAFLLPNTEKLFDKWKDLFTTMLVLFPMFSIVFGGAQLAGTAIIQNADSIVLVILGMMVQVAPVVITPLLIKLSGSLLGRFAGMVNNPKKGLVDRTRNWSKERADLHKARALGTPTSRSQFLRRAAQKKHLKHEREQQWKKAHEAAAEAHVAGDEKYGKATNAVALANMNKEKAEAITAKAFEDMKINNAKVKIADTNLRIAKLDVDVSKAKGEAQWEQYAQTNFGVREQRLTQHLATHRGEESKAKWDNELKEWDSGAASTYAPGSNMSSMISDSQITAQSIAIQAMRKQQAERAGQIDISKVLKQPNSAELVIAGGMMGDQGTNSVLARAKSVVSQADMEDIKNIESTMDYKLKTDIDELEKQFARSTTITQRIAYANAIATNGPPGVEKLAQVIKNYEATNPGQKDILEFKELLGTNANIMKSGKNFENWIANSNPAHNFTQVTDDIKTWNNLKAERFAAMDITQQAVAIAQLQAKDMPAYNRLVEGIKSAPGARQAIKGSILKDMGIT